MSDWKLRLLSYRPSRANRAGAPALAALLLLGGLAVQLALPAPAAIPPGLTARRAPQWPAPRLGDPVVPGGIEAQSLFLPMRAYDAAANTAGGAAAAPVGPLGGAKVLGAEHLGGRTTVLLRTPAGALVRLAPGAVWQDWRLIAVLASEAVFRQPGAAPLHVAFGSTASATPAAPSGSPQ